MEKTRLNKTQSLRKVSTSNMSVGKTTSRGKSHQRDMEDTMRSKDDKGKQAIETLRFFRIRQSRRSKSKDNQQYKLNHNSQSKILSG